MTLKSTGIRKMFAATALACALTIPALTVSAQVPTPRPAASPTPVRVGASPAAGEPMQDATMMAAVLGALVIGGLGLRRFAARRA
ncbi:MAG TPA: hypothetical protein VNM48_13890 [Chloroflexota bacterium]|nr:hypothetical protein [Chloroflexota bacterium]